LKINKKSYTKRKRCVIIY